MILATTIFSIEGVPFPIFQYHPSTNTHTEVAINRLYNYVANKTAQMTVWLI